jgi:uncharacterized protein YjbI with pentapeptide repeats
MLIAILVAAVTAATVIVGVIAPPVIGTTLNDSVSVTPSRLASLLENGNISEFNNERKQIKQQIVFEGIDLSNKDLNGVNLESLVMLHSNLFNTNLENSSLKDVQISGNLSNINLRNAEILNADLRESDLSDVNLTNASLRCRSNKR